MDIYLADTEPLKDKERFDRFFYEMPEIRKRKILRMKQEEPRIQSLGAGILLARAISPFGLSEEDTKTGRFGKPFFPERNDVHFNLSHSGTRIMCVVADRPVGCDVQMITNLSEHEKIARRFFTEKEVCTIEQGKTEKERKDLFFRCWTLKESYIKATGLGMTVPLNRFSIRFDNGEIAVETEDTDAGYSFRELDYHDGYRYAVCIQSEAIPENTPVWIDLSC